MTTKDKRVALRVTPAPGGHDIKLLRLADYQVGGRGSQQAAYYRGDRLDLGLGQIVSKDVARRSINKFVS